MDQDKKLKRDILRALKQVGFACDFTKLKKILMDEYGHERIVKDRLDIFSSRVMHFMQVLEGEGLIKTEQGPMPSNMMIRTMFVSLTSKGHQEFDPVYLKLWRWFTTDMAKILSIVATILSIIAMTAALVR